MKKNLFFSIFIKIIAIVYIIETIIMGFLHLYPDFLTTEEEMIFDPLALSIFSSILIFYFVLEPYAKQRISYEENLKNTAIHDSLTGLLNRETLNIEIAKKMRLSHENGSYIAIAVIDLDDFKLANDAHGHQAGDFILRSISDSLLKTLRKDDVAIRMGGDEFIVMCALRSNSPEEAKKEAFIIMNRIYQIATSSIKYNDKEIYVGASVGCIVFSRIEQSCDYIIDEADKLMYKAKNGNDRIIIENI